MSVVAAVTVASRGLSANVVEVGCFCAFIVLLLASPFLFVCKADKRPMNLVELVKNAAKTVGLFGLLVAMRKYTELEYGGTWAEQKDLVTGAMCGALFLVACLPNPVVPVVVLGAFGSVWFVIGSMMHATPFLLAVRSTLIMPHAACRMPHGTRLQQGALSDAYLGKCTRSSGMFAMTPAHRVD